MCKHQTLAHSVNGYIIRYNKCNHFQIAFGTTVISLYEEEYDEFITQSQVQFHYHTDTKYPNQKNIHLETFCTHVQMVLSFNELGILIDLFNQACVFLEIESILDSSNNYDPNLN